MVKALLFAVVIGFACAVGSHAQTVDELVGKYVKTIGGADKLSAIKSTRTAVVDLRRRW